MTHEVYLIYLPLRPCIAGVRQYVRAVYLIYLPEPPCIAGVRQYVRAVYLIYFPLRPTFRPSVLLSVQEVYLVNLPFRPCIAGELLHHRDLGQLLQNRFMYGLHTIL